MDGWWEEQTKMISIRARAPPKTFQTFSLRTAEKFQKVDGGRRIKFKINLIIELRYGHRHFSACFSVVLAFPPAF